MPCLTIVRFNVRPEQRDAAVAILRALQPEVIAAGAHSIHLYVEDEKPGSVVELELWDNADQHRLFGDHLVASGKLDAILDWLQEDICVRYLDEVASTTA